MKYLALLACLAVVYARYNGPETSFEPNKEYSFKYESQIVTGIRDAGKYVSAMKGEGILKLQFQHNNKVIGKFEDVRMYRLVDELPGDVHPYDALPSERLERLDVPDMVRQFTKPFKFTYLQGKVSDLECESDDPYFSVNVKRALLNVLEVKLEKPQEQYEQYEEHREIAEAYQRNDVRTSTDDDVFAIKENGIEGKCKTIYTILETPEGNKKVHKVKDLEKCENRPFYMTGILSLVKPKTCGTEKSVQNVLTNAEYEVKGTPRSFLISKALYRSQHMIAPLDVKSGVITSYTVQKLVLNTVSDSLTIREPQAPERKKTFWLEIPEPANMHHNHQHHVSSQADVQQLKTEVENLLSEIVRETKPYINPDTSYKLGVLTRFVRELPKETVKQIIDECDQLKKDFLIDLLPADDSSKTVYLIKELLREGTISEMRAIYLLNTHIPMAPPSEDVVDALIPWCKSEYRCSKPLKTIVTLSIGTVANKIYKMKDMLPEEMYRSALEKCENELKSLYNSASEIHEKVVPIKAMANAVLPNLLPKLETIIKHESEHPLVRKQAIYALWNYTYIAPEKVQKICMPIYLDVTNPIEIRIPCFVVIMETKPSLPLMTVITKSLNREPSIEVGSFVFTHMSTLATKECMLDTYKKAKIALLLAKPVIPKYGGASSIYFENFADAWKVGNFYQFATARFEDTMIPNEYFAKFGIIWDKLFVDTFEGKFELRGLKMLEEMLIGREQGIVWQVLKNRMTPREAIDRIIRWVREGEYENASDNMKKISMYFKLFATEFFQMDIYREDINTLVDIVQRKLQAWIPMLMEGLNFDILRPLTTFHTSYTIPTAIGLPLSVNASAYTIARAYGNVHVTGLNSRNINIVKDIKTTTGSVMWFAVGVDLENVMVGSGFLLKSKFQMPLKSVSEINLNQMTFVCNWETPKQEYDMLKTDVIPSVFWAKRPERSFSEMQMIIKENKLSQELCVPETIEKQTSDFFGVGYRMELVRMKPVNKEMSLLPMFYGKHGVKITVQPGYTRPDNIECKAAVLCPTCPMTDTQKHEFLFGSGSSRYQVEAVATDDSWGSWWGGSNRREQRRSSDVSFDEVQPDTSMVDPRLNYKLAFVCKTKQATEQKIIGAQVCMMMNNDLKKYQIDTQFITPFPFSQQLKKIKLITKIALPEYLFQSNALIREGEKTLVHKTEVYIGECHNPTKQCVIETKLSKLPYQWRDIPVELTPVKLETKISEMRRLPEPLLTVVKKAVVALKTSYWAVLNNYINVYDLLEYTLQPIDPERITLEARIFPTELKAEYRIKMEELYTKLEVCPYKLPWSVPVKPITYQNLPSTYDYQQQQREEDNQWEDSQYEQCERRLLTKKLRRTIEDEVCFSIEPVYTCKGACRRPEQYDRQQVEFTCMPRSSAKAQRLISESLQRPLYDLRYESRDLVHEVPIPLYCEAY